MTAAAAGAPTSHNPEHLAALRSKHETLDQALAEEQQRPKPDELRIQELKKQKLHIKQQLEN
jgi:hypothetical protein